MNRYMVGVMAALLLAPAHEIAGQAAARVEYRNGRMGVGVTLGHIPVRVGPHGPVARGWVAADWGPLRVRIVSRRPSFTGRLLHRQELRYLLGKETVRRIEHHARRLGVHGRTVGRWFHLDRGASVLEVTVGRIPVAELYDYRSDGFIDEMFLTGPPRYARYGEWRYGGHGVWQDGWGGRWDDDWEDGDWDDGWDDWDDRDDDRDDRPFHRRPSGRGRPG